MSAEHGGFSSPFSFDSRFGDGAHISPEDLVAAAQAGCYAMALSNELASGGNTPNRVDVGATVTLGPDPAGGFHISSVDLVVKADVPGISDEAFQAAAEATRTGCPIAKLFAGTTITVDATLAA